MSNEFEHISNFFRVYDATHIFIKSKNAEKFKYRHRRRLGRGCGGCMDKQTGWLINPFDFCQPITDVLYGQLSKERAQFL